ncbi:MAG: family 16 glycoside hydrolase, partial [Rhodothermales bacterium]
LWQHFRILFQAPRFDQAGRKIADARFVLVELNDAVIHENVTVTGPTRAAAFTDEKPLGPLMLQGDHGPVAFRNLRIKRYGEEPARLDDLRYRAYIEPTLDVGSATIRGEGMAVAVSADRGGDRDRFGMAYEGTLIASTEGDYLFDLELEWVDNDPHFEGAVTGAGRLYLGDREVVRHDGRAPHATGTVTLVPGSHPFRLVFFKDRPWNEPRMTLHVEGPGFARTPLHDLGALPPVAGVGAITVSADAEPVVQRTFIPFEGGKRTHAAAVGDPTGVHYAIDLASGAILYVWRGPFIEATPMWHERGSDQISIPLGSVVAFSGGPAVAALSMPNQPWPAASAEFAFGGYVLDAEGRPTFTYHVGDARIEDAVRPAEEGRSLHRSLRITQGQDITVRLAGGERINPVDGGGFRVDEEYYIEPDAGLAPSIRHIQGRDELVVLVGSGNAAEIGYTVVW